MLPTFDPTKRHHVARQLALAASFGQKIADHPQKLSMDSALTVDAIMTTLRNYCCELKRSLDGQPITGAHLAMCARGLQTSVRLIQAMLDADPTLLRYDPRTTPARLAETCLHYLAHSVIAFYRVVHSQELGAA